jgi:hypothetical protein
MNNQDLTKIIDLLHNNSDSFYTGLSAYKRGFKTDLDKYYSLYSLYKEDVLNHIAKQTPHLLIPYTKFEGKLNKTFDIIVSRNVNLFSDDVIINDINKDNLSKYFLVINHLSQIVIEKVYSLIDKDNLHLIKKHNILLPNRYIKESFLIPYTNYLAGTNNYYQFLASYDQAVFYFNNFSEISPINKEVMEKYLLDNITIICKESAENFYNKGISLTSIIKYKPKLVMFLFDKVNTLGEFKLILRNLNIHTSMEFIIELKKTFPKFEKLIDDRLEVIINT